MTTKEWLNRGFKINKEIEQLIEARQNAENLACNVVSNVNNERISINSRNTNEDRFINVADYSLVLHRRINQLLEVQKEIVKAISGVENSTLRTILIARYINFKTWDEISEELNYDTDCKYIFKLHRKALKEIKIGH